MKAKRKRGSRRAIAALAAAIAGIGSPFVPVLAGIETTPATEYDFLFPQTRQAPAAPTVQPEIAPPIEEPIDPETYRVTPGDLLQLDVGGETDRSWRLAVTAEGKLLIPGSPAIDAIGLTLAALQETVRSRLAARFPGKPIDLSMLQPGAFRVPVTGQVGIPGIHPLHGYDRVTVALYLAGNPLPGASTRGIEVTGPEGMVREIDLVRFALLGELDQNPFLEPGMSIQVPPAREFVRVTGAVRGIPGDKGPMIPTAGSRIPETPNLQLEWKEGDTAGFAIMRAGGLSEEASGTILLLRGDERRSFISAAADTTTVLPGDVIEAAVRERWVYVNGAVRYPGPYPHLPSYTASDYVRIAGGPTEIGRGGGWTLRPAGSDETHRVGKESFVPPGSTIIVGERWTYRTSTLLAPISGVTALIISLVALRR